MYLARVRILWPMHELGLVFGLIPWIIILIGFKFEAWFEAKFGAWFGAWLRTFLSG